MSKQSVVPGSPGCPFCKKWGWEHFASKKVSCPRAGMEAWEFWCIHCGTLGFVLHPLGSERYVLEWNWTIEEALEEYDWDMKRRKKKA